MCIASGNPRATNRGDGPLESNLESTSDPSLSILGPHIGGWNGVSLPLLPLSLALRSLTARSLVESPCLIPQRILAGLLLPCPASTPIIEAGRTSNAGADKRHRDQPAPTSLAPSASARALRRGAFRLDRRPGASQARPCALSTWHGAGTCPRECAIVGYARRDWTDDDLRAEYEKTLAKGGGAGFPGHLAPVRQSPGLRRRHVRRPAKRTASSRRSSKSSTGRTARGATAIYYLAVSPEFFATIISHLGEAGLIYPWQQETPWSRVVIEKPFGHDLASARSAEPRRLARARRAAGLSHRPLPGQGDGPEHPGLPVRQQHLRADLEPAARGLGADHRGRGSGHGRRPGCLLRHRRRDPRHGPEPHDAAALPGGDGAAGGPLGRRRPQREGQGASGLAALEAAGRPQECRAGPVHGRLDRGRGGPRLPPGEGVVDRTR